MGTRRRRALRCNVGTRTVAHLVWVGALWAAGVGCDRRVEPADPPPSRGSDDALEAKTSARPRCQDTPRTPILELGEGCGWALMTAGIVTEHGGAATAPESGVPSAAAAGQGKAPGAMRGPGTDQARNSTPALVVMSLAEPPEAMVSTVPVPSWCADAARCEVQAAVVDGHRALVRVSGGATHVDTPSSREAFWLASAGPAFWFEPGDEEPWIDGGVRVGSATRFVPRRCNDEVVARVGPKRRAAWWWRWSGARVPCGTPARSPPRRTGAVGLTGRCPSFGDKSPGSDGRLSGVHSTGPLRCRRPRGYVAP